MLIDNCTSLKYVEQIFFVIGGPATSLLFFLRVRAVYNRSRIITAFFGILWLGITGTSILITIGTTDSESLVVSHIGTSRMTSRDVQKVIYHTHGVV
jgi:hypothetical protein